MTRSVGRHREGLLLAGDIGGTKALLALVRAGRVTFERRYLCASFRSCAALIERFLSEARRTLGSRAQAEHACLAVAGPVGEGRAHVTHLGWDIDADELGIASVRLMNDCEASAYALRQLRRRDRETLQPGMPLKGAPRLVIAAGTGLGLAFAFGEGRASRVVPGEGGHAAFAPADATQAALWQSLHGSLGRVELDQVISGPGLVRAYDFLRDTGHYPASAALHAAEGAADPAQMIAQAALQAGDPLALAAVDLFIACYGAAAGDSALAVRARGGVYVAGGIAPKLLYRLRVGGFIQAFNAKGVFSRLTAECPVSVVLDERLALRGAVAAGRQ